MPFVHQVNYFQMIILQESKSLSHPLNTRYKILLQPIDMAATSDAVFEQLFENNRGALIFSYI
jgi:hypothetical protein